MKTSCVKAERKVPKIVRQKFACYSEPKTTKTCTLCGKEISTKWKSDICLQCGDIMEVQK